jgi:hypothetical protein
LESTKLEDAAASAGPFRQKASREQGSRRLAGTARANNLSHEEEETANSNRAEVLCSAVGISLPKNYCMRILTDGFSAEVDVVDKSQWEEISRGFIDANIYQTWPYATVRSGRGNVTHLLLMQNGAVVAAVQARLAKIPCLNFGIVYVFWGPLWKRHNAAIDVEMFRQALRAIRTEYVGRRRLVVRIVPNLPDSDNEPFRRIFEEEGYAFQPQIKRRRTILMDIRPPIEQLYRGLHKTWRNHLNRARKEELEFVEGEEEVLFEAFEGIYAEMMGRKQFVEFADPAEYRAVQSELPPDQKMRVFLCKNHEGLCHGAICTTFGNTGMSLFGATSNRGKKYNASYLLHWRMLEWMKSRGCQFNDLNGINPIENPSLYEFKSRFAGAHGHDVHLLGAFDAYPNVTMKLLVAAADALRPHLKQAVAYFSCPKSSK